METELGNQSITVTDVQGWATFLQIYIYILSTKSTQTAFKLHKLFILIMKKIFDLDLKGEVALDARAFLLRAFHHCF